MSKENLSEWSVSNNRKLGLNHIPVCTEGNLRKHGLQGSKVALSAIVTLAVTVLTFSQYVPAPATFWCIPGIQGIYLYTCTLLSQGPPTGVHRLGPVSMG